MRPAHWEHRCGDGRSRSGRSLRRRQQSLGRRLPFGLPLHRSVRQRHRRFRSRRNVRRQPRLRAGLPLDPSLRRRSSRRWASSVTTATPHAGTDVHPNVCASKASGSSAFFFASDTGRVGCDFSGDGRPDNAFAHALGNATGILNTAITNGISNGNFILQVGFIGLHDPLGMNEPMLRAGWMRGLDGDMDPMNKQDPGNPQESRASLNMLICPPNYQGRSSARISTAVPKTFFSICLDRWACRSRSSRSLDAARNASQRRHTHLALRHARERNERRHAVRRHRRARPGDGAQLLRTPRAAAAAAPERSSKRSSAATPS